ncbi:hypothetical protein HMPREF0782_0552, partial [Staphylococcus aureus subsp. aureus ATCC 51811]
QRAVLINKIHITKSCISIQINNKKSAFFTLPKNFKELNVPSSFLLYLIRNL